MERVKNFPDVSQEIRLHHKKLRQEMSREKVTEASETICAKLYEAPWYQKCTWIYGYYPLGNEVDCRSFLKKALEDGKHVALPRTATKPEYAKACYMEFYEITSLKDVTKGSFGVSEPDVNCPQAMEGEAVVLVPGVVFDRQGNRYGYGKGYYDRYFARFPELYKIGLAYENQMEERLMVSETDVKMDCIYTEQKVDC